LLVQNVSQEGHQLAQGGDVRHPSGRDVLDPADHTVRRLGARVEVQYESAVGRQFEPAPGGRTPTRLGRIQLALHGSDDTAASPPRAMERALDCG